MFTAALHGVDAQWCVMAAASSEGWGDQAFSVLHVKGFGKQGYAEENYARNADSFSVEPIIKTICSLQNENLFFFASIGRNGR